MSFSTAFKSFEHGIAKTAKWIATGLGDVINFAAKDAPVAAEVTKLASVVGGPLGGLLSNLGFNLFGEVAGALKGIQVDATQATHSVTLQLATQTALDVQSATSTIEKAVEAVGGALPKK